MLHCFSGDVDFARACLDRGAYLSFAGTVTFKNAANLRRALAAGADGPHPGRDRRALPDADAASAGGPNASYLVPHTVRAMAEVRNVQLERLCEAIDANTDARVRRSLGLTRARAVQAPASGVTAVSPAVVICS